MMDDGRWTMSFLAARSFGIGVFCVFVADFHLRILAELAFSHPIQRETTKWPTNLANAGEYDIQGLAKN
ncbi:MAG TPA: hypothetical protein VHS96_03770 [Bacteroidia bacterium]|nr:hypothetical protein [Bacteroidia bacterium]